MPSFNKGITEMKKMLICLLLMVSTQAMAEVKIGSGKIDSAGGQLSFNLNVLNPKYVYNIACTVTGPVGSTAPVLHFGTEYKNGLLQSGTVYFDNRQLATNQAQVSGSHTAEYRNLRNSGDNLLDIGYVDGTGSVTVDCYASAAVGAK